MRIVALLACLGAMMPVEGIADPSVDSAVSDLMGQGTRAYASGDYDTAKELFTEVLQVQPNNVVAIQFLRSIGVKQAGLAPSANTGLDKLVLPKVELAGATFSAALHFLKQQAAAQSVTVSFVSQLPASQMEKKITLNLSQIPFLEALRYLCALNRATFKSERYAILITPAPAASPEPVAPAQ